MDQKPDIVHLFSQPPAAEFIAGQQMFSVACRGQICAEMHAPGSGAVHAPGRCSSRLRSFLAPGRRERGRNHPGWVICAPPQCGRM